MITMLPPNQKVEFYIPKHIKYVFVADMFAEDYTGGAELTTEALITSAPGPTFKLHSRSLTHDLVEANKDKTWIFCNWSGAARDVVLNFPMTKDIRYFVVEYDYKFCAYRSTHLHQRQTATECNCHITKFGRYTNFLYKNAEHVFFMSEKQRQEFFKRFHDFRDAGNSSILSSVWTPEDLQFLSEEGTLSLDKRTKAGVWAILGGGSSWIKDVEATKEYCKAKGIPWEQIPTKPYREFLKSLSEYQGLVFQPAGFDTCPRLVVEAKLLGLELDLNENVQHASEEWFTGSREDVVKYLQMGPQDRFWNTVVIKK